MASAQELVARGLPETCFTVAPGTDDVVMLRLGERGYRPTTYNRQGTADALNRKLGVTDEQARAMLAGSMCGWDCKGSKL